ncbi:MAG: hypothetical protein HUJ26_17015 [Planctomycetaceae bacterium]|nr:hypothetical protein [Planctomycetaceae bacterium]
MHRFSFHIVWLLLMIAGLSVIYGGPWWAYPLMLLLVTIFTAFVVAYPSDNSLRRTLAGFGGLLILGAATRFASDGITRLIVHESLSVFLTGLACLWSAVFPFPQPTASYDQPSMRHKITQSEATE